MRARVSADGEYIHDDNYRVVMRNLGIIVLSAPRCVLRLDESWMFVRHDEDSFSTEEVTLP